MESSIPVKKKQKTKQINPNDVRHSLFWVPDMCKLYLTLYSKVHQRYKKLSSANEACEHEITHEAN